MASDFSFSFDRSKFENSKEMNKKINRALFATARYWDGRVEAHAKQNAPWKDQTTNARNGLRAKAAKIAKNYAIILSHSVTYGIYLELPHDHERADGTTYTIGPNPIIMPTIKLYAPKVMRSLRKMLDRL